MLEEYKGYSITWDIDEFPPDPANEWDMVTWFPLFHNRYTLGHQDNPYDPKQFGGWEELWGHIEADLGDDIIRVKPVYMYDHSGITLRMGRGFSCPWDSGQVGWAIVLKSRWDKLHGAPIEEVDSDLLDRVMRDDFDEYNAYLSGEVYCCRIHDEHGADVETICGIYGYDAAKSYEEDAKAIIENDIERRRKRQREELKAELERRKAYIRYNVPLSKREPFYQPEL